ncbi:MAG: class I SAM-dependent methyltransferase [Deferribacterales bacterium]
MDFYEMLAMNYDIIFPFSQEMADFVLSLTPVAGKILDIGSATGKYISHYIAKGYRAFGLEYCPKLIAYKNSTVVGDMNSLPFQEGFDTAVCMGNTLVHAASYKHAHNILSGIYNLLEKDGRAVVQILNYERILRQKPMFLPAIKTPSCTFERRYEYHGGKILFTGTLTSGSRKMKSEVTLCPITPRELMDMSFDSGFRQVLYYGGSKGEAFDMDESFALTAVLQK